ncbi:hypothetical protein BDV98DRAFT_575369 [Pterulicium gracile]|uniref:Uncharacterized protein n=1 Tax=Pterulicium gracile TaxID=1884261 RepID=A0A5C3Q488_9AGAR|nr:hypothetical protein BDV98DRAFT_575369 [Pterula gracilis]
MTYALIRRTTYVAGNITYDTAKEHTIKIKNIKAGTFSSCMELGAFVIYNDATPKNDPVSTSSDPRASSTPSEVVDGSSDFGRDSLSTFPRSLGSNRCSGFGPVDSCTLLPSAMPAMPGWCLSRGPYARTISGDITSHFISCSGHDLSSTL